MGLTRRQMVDYKLGVGACETACSIRRWLVGLLLLLVAVSASATSITGTAKYPSGVSFNGSIVFTLAVPSQSPSSTLVVPNQGVKVLVVAGLVVGTPTLMGNDTLQPSSYYRAQWFNTAGKLVIENAYVITGATFDLGSAVPTAITTNNVSYQDLLGMRSFGGETMVLNKYLDLKTISQPVNPNTNYNRAFIDAATGKLNCINATGTSCLPGTTGNVLGTGTVNFLTRWIVSGGAVTNNTSFHGNGTIMTVTVSSTTGFTNGDTVTVSGTSMCTVGAVYLPLFDGAHGPITVASGTTYTYLEAGFNGPTYDVNGPVPFGCPTPAGNTTGTTSVGAVSTSSQIGDGSIADDGTKATAKILNKTIYADSITNCTASGGSNPCTNAGQKIVEANFQLPAGGGTIDATGFDHTAQAITAGFIIGNAAGTKPVTLLVDAAQEFTVTVAGGVDVIKLGGKSALVGVGTKVTGGNTCTFQLAATSNIKSLYTVANRAINTAHTKTENVSFCGHPSATVSDGLVDPQGMTDTSTFTDVLIYNFPGIGLRLRNNTGVGMGPIDFHNVTVNGPTPQLAGTRPVVIESVNNGGLMSGITFSGATTINRAGNGQALVTIDGSAYPAANGTAIMATHFENLYLEAGAAGANIGVYVKDADQTVFGNIIGGNGGGTFADVLKIDEGAAGNTNGVIALGAQCQTTCTNLINDVPNGITYAASTMALYVYRSRLSAIDSVIGRTRLTPVTFAEMTGGVLATAPNGTVVFCSDCNATCAAGAGTGRTCFRENGAWIH